MACWLLVQAITMMTVVKAQRNSNLSNRKPVVDLKKEIIKATRKLPEERRKSSIFPKNTQKFVITSPPYSKVRSYTPRPIFMTKKTFMPVYKPSITTRESVTVSPLMRSFDSVGSWPAKVPESRIHRRIIGEKYVNNSKGHKINQDKDFDKENQIKDDAEEISTGLPEFADELTEDNENNVLVDFNALSELDNERIKRFAVHGPVHIHDSWNLKNIARVPSGNNNEADDEDEFIFLDKKTESKPSNSNKLSSHISSKAKRNVNVIEEEARVTPEPHFSIGREAKLNSAAVFNNIHV
nr:uncharacterized protein LOC128678683 isoform X2 [Plodia interpunctella]